MANRKVETRPIDVKMIKQQMPLTETKNRFANISKQAQCQFSFDEICLISSGLQMSVRR